MPASKKPDSARRAAELLVLEARLGHRFERPELLDRSLAHRSWCAEHHGYLSNERLEFLGDAVLGLVVATLAFEQFADFPEGKLSDLRKGVVNAEALAEVARSLDLGAHLLLGRGEAAGGGRNKTSILADAMEAVIGAIYIDAGLDAAAPFVERLFAEPMGRVAQRLHRLDHKTMLQEVAAHRFEVAPTYLVKESGPDHAKRFLATAFLHGVEYGSGSGRTKKAAEQAAAEATIDMLD